MPAAKPPARPLPSIDVETADFYEAFQEVLRLYQFRDRNRASTHGLSVHQCYALEAVDRLGPLTLNEVAGRLALDKSSASRIVTSLEKAGFVRRSALSTDARALQLEATPAGAELHERIRRDIMARQQKLLAEFEPATRRAVTRFLRRLARSLQPTCGVRGR